MKKNVLKSTVMCFKQRFLFKVRQSGLTREAIHKECTSLLDLTQGIV